MRITRFLLFSLLSVVLCVTGAFADTTTNYTFVKTESSSSINTTKGAYNSLGTLKVTRPAGVTDAFDTRYKVDVMVTRNSSFTNQSKDASTFDYSLAYGEGKTPLASGNNITFSAASIDAGEGVEIFALITGDPVTAADGIYDDTLDFTAILTLDPQVGDTLKFGQYTVNSEPVSLDWIVISADKVNNRALLITDKAIASMRYHASSNAWSTSEIRTWLQNTFLTDTNFTAYEQAKILSVDISNKDEQQERPITAWGSGDDKMFLLSTEEARYAPYFTNNDMRKCQKFSGESYIIWWLRSPGGYDTNAACVETDGSVNTFSYGVFQSESWTCFRPAFWMNLYTDSSLTDTLNVSFKLIHDYTIFYKLGGGANSELNPSIYTIESPDITLEPATPATGYSFDKWTSGDETVTKIPHGTAGNLTLTAHYTANNYAIAFNANNGTGTMSTQSFTYDEAAKALTTNSFTRTGYTFSDWNTKSDGTGTSYTDGQSVQNLTSAADETITLYAQWTVNKYTLTFVTNGGTAINPITQNYDTAVTAPANPTKTGYTFANWDKTIPAKMPAEDLTFTANWTAENYTITYDLDGGTVTTENPTSYTIESSAITLNNPTKTGYEFAGWTGTDLTEATKTVTIAKGSTGNRSYKATYTETTPASTVVTVTPEAILEMTPEKIAETLGEEKTLALTGTMTAEKLIEVLEKVAGVTETITTLDLSQVEGLEEVKLDSEIKVESLVLAGNKSIKTIETRGSSSIKTIDLTGSSVETLDVKGCENLESLNVEGCESLVQLDVSETNVASLNVRGCKNLTQLDCSSGVIKELILDGCESIKDVVCSGNSLMKLNVSGFTTLERLECGSQTVTDLVLLETMSFVDIFNGSFAASAFDESDLDNIDNLKAYDSAGKEISIEYDETTGEVNFSSVPAKFTYDYATGFTPPQAGRDIKMDVTIGDADIDIDENNDLGPSGGGCNNGWGLLALLALMKLYAKIK